MTTLPPGDEITLDHLAGSWKIHQLKRGHRFSTDDMVTAWRAAHARPGARRLLDLGCGIGTVGLLTLWRLGHEDASLTGVEAQEISVHLARKTIAFNGLADRVEVRHGDLRDPDVLDPSARFELITGSPPYIPLGTGLISPHPQRAACRIELRGSVFDYCETAARHLDDDGRFVFVMAAQDPRTEEAPRAAGLDVVERTDVVFGRDREPHIATLVCAREFSGRRQTRTLVVRGGDGEWTDDYMAFRKEMGMRSRPGSR